MFKPHKIIMEGLNKIYELENKYNKHIDHDNLISHAGNDENNEDDGEDREEITILDNDVNLFQKKYITLSKLNDISLIKTFPNALLIKNSNIDKNKENNKKVLVG